MSTFMKQHFFYLFLAMNLFLMACSSGDSEDSEQLDGVHFVEHHKDTYGVTEVNNGTVISFNCKFCDKYGHLAKDKIRSLEFLGHTQSHTTTNNADIVFNVDCYAFYYSVLERDQYYEYKDGYRRTLQKNIHLTVSYVGCTPETPTYMIPKDQETHKYTYPDIVGEWVPYTPGMDEANEDDGTGGGDGGNSGSSDTSLFTISPVSVTTIITSDEKSGTLIYNSYYKWVNRDSGKILLSGSKDSYRNKGHVGKNSDSYKCNYYVGGFTYRSVQHDGIGVTKYHYFN